MTQHSAQEAAEAMLGGPVMAITTSVKKKTSSSNLPRETRKKENKDQLRNKLTRDEKDNKKMKLRTVFFF